MRLRLRAGALGLILSFLFSNSNAQSEKWPSSFLWKISGNGLDRPSWLYGTMHLKDRRLFQFGDSLYFALEQAKGFALELDMKEYLDSVLVQGMLESEEHHFGVGTDPDQIDDPRRRKKLIDSLIADAKVNRQTRKMLASYRDRKWKSSESPDDMPTFMDAYLLMIAQRQNKWIGGVEDVADQMELSDELGAGLDANELIRSQSETRKLLETMIQAYIRQDLDAINKHFIDDSDSSSRKILLDNRNGKMADRMDSLSKIRTRFFAVGAAHLPGERGVIKKS